MDIIRKKTDIGDILINGGILSSDDLKRGLEIQKETGCKLMEALVDEGFVTEENLARALSEQLHYDLVELQNVEINEDILMLVPVSVLKKYKALPLGYSKDNMMLRVAMADPMDLTALDDINIITNMQIEPVVATMSGILLAIDRYYGQAQVDMALEEYAKEKENKKMVREDFYNEDVNNSPIVQLVRSMIEQAVRQRASDIHIEPMERYVRIRYRIDGVLYEKATYSIGILPTIVARVKIIGGMDISEKRKPQDGRITQIVDRREYDIRVSALPIVYGEKLVMRIASKNALTKDKSKLGLRPDELKKFDHMLKNPHGILLVTGPTGSGKSTTLYTALSELNNEEVNIVTVEDPVEANIDGVNQVQVNNKVDLTFASALRSILRQDPDIIMIGEIRDRETAAIAIQASITGHLVVSTLHTNSAAGTITRLVDMGIEPYLIADATIGVIAQRLVRRLCPVCRKPKKADAHELELLMKSPEEEVTVYEPCGCPKCDETGFKGRIGVFEIMEMTQSLKTLIGRNGSTEDIRKQALEEGMGTLRMSAAKYVLEGITSISEMMRVSFDD